MTQFRTLSISGRIATVAAIACGLFAAGCAGGGHDEKPATNTSSRSNPLSTMLRITVFARVPNTPDTSYQCYLAQTPGQRNEGLSFVSEEELLSAPGAPGRGMVFVYPTNQQIAFTGRNTIIDLDVVYAVGVAPGVGQIVDITGISAFQRGLTISSVPVQYALMVPRGQLAKSGAKVGDFLYVAVNTPAQ